MEATISSFSNEVEVLLISLQYSWFTWCNSWIATFVMSVRVFVSCNDSIGAKTKIESKDSLHKKWSFLLRIPSVPVIKSCKFKQSLEQLLAIPHMILRTFIGHSILFKRINKIGISLFISDWQKCMAIVSYITKI